MFGVSSTLKNTRYGNTRPQRQPQTFITISLNQTSLFDSDDQTLLGRLKHTIIMFFSPIPEQIIKLNVLR